MRTALIIILTTLTYPLFSQNLIQNPDFNDSLNNWATTAGTTLIPGTDTVAYVSGSNVLYQKVTGITVGKTYRCIIECTDVVIKQTTGYGFAIEKSAPIVFPEFTRGSSDMNKVCTDNGGSWIQPPAEAVGAQTFIIDITIPDEATAIYICIATKGAAAKLSVTSVSFEEAMPKDVIFNVKDKETNTNLNNAEIVIEGVPGTHITDTNGNVTVGLVPSLTPYTFNVQRNWFKEIFADITVTESTDNYLVELDSIQEIKDVQTIISKYGDNATPYPIYGHMWSAGLVYTQEEIDLLTSNLDYLIGGGELTNDSNIVKLFHEANDKFQVIKYQGDWSIKKGAGENAKMDLVYYKCGTLASGIDESATSFVINAPSKGGGILASEPGNFDVWIRIQNELMKVTAVSSTTAYPITVTVERGLDNTTPSAYTAGTTVTLPQYNVVPVPGESGLGIKYQSAVHGTRKYNLEEKLFSGAKISHYDGIWIDIAIGRLGAKSILGDKFEEWDHRIEAPMTSINDVKYTKQTLNDMYIKFYSRMGYYPAIYANNVLYSHTLTSSDRAWLMVKEPEYTRVLDGFCHENSWGHCQTDDSGIDHEGQVETSEGSIKEYGSDGRYLQWSINDSWLDKCKAITLQAQAGLPNQPVTINAGYKNQWFAESFPEDSRYRFNRYSYASYLLCVDVAADSSISCRMGISTARVINNATSVVVEPYFFYDIGLPTEKQTWNNFTNYRHAGHNLYSRNFSNGVVVLNPFAAGMSQAVDISTITGDNRTYINPEQDSAVVTSVQLDSLESMILLVNENANAFDEYYTASLFTIYPNPVQDMLTVSLKPGANMYNQHIKVFSIKGTLVSEQVIYPGQKTRINVSDLPEGLYYVQLSTNGETRKFIKQ